MSSTYSRNRALLIDLFAIGILALDFILVDSLLAPSVSSDFHVTNFWFTVAALGIFFFLAIFAYAIYRFFRDLASVIFHAVSQSRSRKEARNV